MVGIREEGVVVGQGNVGRLDLFASKESSMQGIDGSYGSGNGRRLHVDVSVSGGLVDEEVNYAPETLTLFYHLVP